VHRRSFGRFIKPNDPRFTDEPRVTRLDEPGTQAGALPAMPTKVDSYQLAFIGIFCTSIPVEAVA
jgi:hypothetical protein